MDFPWSIFFMLIGVRLIEGACGGCSSRNVQCVTATSYKLCNRGVPVEVTYNCNANDFCVSENANICVSSGPPDCTCGTCIGGISCTSRTQFKLCLGGLTTPNTVAISCPNNTFCDTTSTAPNYCTAVSTNSGCFVSQASCTVKGRFPIPGTSCTKYMLCTAGSTGLFVSSELTCPGTSVFNPDTQRCTTPYICRS